MHEFFTYETKSKLYFELLWEVVGCNQSSYWMKFLVFLHKIILLGESLKDYRNFDLMQKVLSGSFGRAGVVCSVGGLRINQSLVFLQQARKFLIFFWEIIQYFTFPSSLLNTLFCQVFLVSQKYLVLSSIFSVPKRQVLFKNRFLINVSWKY